MFRNILVAIDESRPSAAALEEAVELARNDGARLVLMSVATPVRFRFSGPPYVPYPTEQELERAAWDIVRRAEALVPPDVPVSTVVRCGRPAAAIVARATEGGHDLVVVGSHRRGRLGSLLLGSVSRTVVARCPVPVLIAGRRRDDEARTVGGTTHQLQAERPAPAMSVDAEPATKGEPALFLWLVVALLLEIQLVLWLFNGTYAE